MKYPHETRFLSLTGTYVSKSSAIRFADNANIHIRHTIKQPFPRKKTMLSVHSTNVFQLKTIAYKR